MQVPAAWSESVVGIFAQPDRCVYTVDERPLLSFHVQGCYCCQGGTVSVYGGFHDVDVGPIGCITVNSLCLIRDRADRSVCLKHWIPLDPMLRRLKIIL